MVLLRGPDREHAFSVLLGPAAMDYVFAVGVRGVHRIHEHSATGCNHQSIMNPTWTYRIDGEDLVVDDVYATCFGGKYDAGDNGQTESGVLNDGSDPNLMGVALPIRSVEAATRPSPLAFKGPHIPWLSIVSVWKTVEGEDTAIYGRLIDNGPNVLKFPTHAIDLNPPMALHFAPEQDPKRIANDWAEPHFSYRIVGGAKWVS